MVQIKKVIKELEKAKRPIICAGGGVLLSGAEGILREDQRNMGSYIFTDFRRVYINMYQYFIICN